LSRLPGIITASEELTPGVTQITFMITGGEFAFSPGQAVTLEMGGVVRTYCIASAPQRPNALQLAIRIGEGDGSAAVRELKPGDPIEIDGPEGEFIAPTDEKHLVLIGGDTGIAPMRSIVLHLVATEDGRPITVLSEPVSNEMYGADFRPLAAAGRITYATGKIEDLVAAHAESIRGANVMAAGFQPFLDRVARALGEAGVPAGQVRYETYGYLAQPAR
jgi:ferredoxin-NADP reductase